MTISLLDFSIAALLDSGAATSLIGDFVFELCKAKKISLRESKTLLQLATGTAITAGVAVRPQIRLNGKKRRQRFLYMPGLVVPLILGRDFITGESMTLDFLVAHTGWDSNRS